MKAKADDYLLVVSEAQSRQVSILLGKVGQAADHPCELVDAGRIAKKQNERKKTPKPAQASMLKHNNIVRKRGEKQLCGPWIPSL